MRSYAPLSLALLLCACGPVSAPTSAPVSRGTTDIAKFHAAVQGAPARCRADSALAREQDQLLREINRARAEEGLGPVRFEPRLAAAAHAHACANAKDGVISHIGTDGSRPGHRALRAGYDYRIVAENLGLGFHGAEQAMFYWMRSPGHRVNVLKPEVRDAALGLTQTATGQKTWVLMLGKTR